MFFTVVQSGQTKHLLSFYVNWKLPQVLFHAWKGEWDEGYSAATCNFSTRWHQILHTETLKLTTKEGGPHSNHWNKQWFIEIKSKLSKAL